MSLRHVLILCFLSRIAGASIGNGDGVCDGINADIMFILDATTKDFFYEMNRFMGRFIYHFREGMDQNRPRFAASSFSTESEICFNFTKPYSNSTNSRPSPDFTFSSCKVEFPVIKTLTNATKLFKSQRNTAEAIQKARNQFQRNVQPGVVKFAILATDGLPQDCNKTLNEAQMLKLVNGVIMIVITTNQMPSATELVSLASSPLHLIYIDETDFKSTLNHQLLDLLCKRHLQRTKRSVTCHDESHTVSPGRICIRLRWEVSNHPEQYYYTGTPPNDCYPAGDTTVRIMKYGSSTVQCTYHVRVTVYYCSSLPATDPNGRRSCTGDADNVYGSTCYHYCNSGYSLIGASAVTCNLISGSAQWSSNFPSCQVQHCQELPFFPYGSRQCTRSEANMFQSVCTHTCISDFTLHGSSRIECLAQSSTVRWSSVFPVCHASGQPNLSTCRISVTDSQGQDTLSGYLSNDTSCKNQRDEWIRTRPQVLHFAIKADHNPNIPKPQGISEVKAGVVEAIIKVITLSVSGSETIVLQKILNSKDTCQEGANSTSPLYAGKILDCEGNLTLTSLNLNDGERVCADITAYSGGYYNLVDGNNNFQKQVIFEKIPSRTKRVCFMYDNSKPVHCFAKGCNAQPLELSSRTTRSPLIQVKVSGWEDPVPRNGPSSSASHISKYKLEIHQVDTGLNYLSVQNGEMSNSTKEWNEISAGQYYINMSLPIENPHMYGIILEVHDFAGNVRFARRLVLLDNSSFVDLRRNYSLRVTTADMRSNFAWQGNSSRVCIDWQYRFYNTEMVMNNLLMPVREDRGREIYGHYDQVQGLLSVNGTNNAYGVVRFELSWSGNEGNKFMLGDVMPVQTQIACFSVNLTDGDTCRVVVQAFDIMNNTEEDSVHVNIDHSGPVVTIQAVHGFLGQHGLLINDTTALSQVVLSVQAMDPHSGIRTLQWVLGVNGRQANIGNGIIDVNRLIKKQMNCTGREHCYCPVVGPCELSEHQMKFAYHQEEFNMDKHGDIQTNQYYLNITSTNNAGLSSTEHLDIVLNMTSYSTIIILDGLTLVLKDDENSDEENNAGIIVGAVLGTIIAIIGCILLIVFTRKRLTRRRLQKETSSQANLEENKDKKPKGISADNHAMNFNNAIYDKINPARNAQEESRVYSTFIPCQSVKDDEIIYENIEGYSFT